MGRHTSDREDREVERGERRQVRVVEPVRDALADLSKDRGETYSETLDNFLPDDWEDTVYGYEDAEIRYLKLTPEVHEKVTAMAGPRVRAGDIIALYLLIGVVNSGDLEAAREISNRIPTVVWDALQEPTEIEQ